MFKNVASQSICMFAFTTTTGVPKTGDAANITPYITKDFGAVTALTDTSATEMDATNAPGWYKFDVTQTESNADAILFTAKSATANISVVGQFVYTTPASFTAFVTPTGAAVNATQLAGQTITASGGVTFPAATLASTTNITAATGVTLTATTGLGNQTADITGNLSGSVGSVTGAVGSVTGAVGSVTGAVGSVTAGVTLAASAVQAIWDALTSALTTVGSIGKKLADWTIGTTQTGDSYARLGAPAGASIAADIAAVNVIVTAIQGYVDTEVAAIKAKTDNLPASPANEATLTTIAGYIDTEVAAIKAKTDNLPTDPADASDIAASFASIASTLATLATYVDTEVAAIKAKTDSLTFTTAGQVDANIQSINDTALVGNGSSTPWGP